MHIVSLLYHLVFHQVLAMKQSELKGCDHWELKAAPVKGKIGSQRVKNVEGTQKKCYMQENSTTHIGFCYLKRAHSVTTSQLTHDWSLVVMLAWNLRERTHNVLARSLNAQKAALLFNGLLACFILPGYSIWVMKCSKSWNPAKPNTLKEDDADLGNSLVQNSILNQRTPR